MVDQRSSSSSAGSRWRWLVLLLGTVLTLMVLGYMAAIWLGALGMNVHFSGQSGVYVVPLALVLMLVIAVTLTQRRNRRER